MGSFRSCPGPKLTATFAVGYRPEHVSFFKHFYTSSLKLCEVSLPLENIFPIYLSQVPTS